MPGEPEHETRVILYGTNFRHAVEFSRSGCAPSQLFPAGLGQPESRYLVGSARSNTTGTTQTPTWSGRSMSGTSCLGENIHPASLAPTLLLLRPGAVGDSVARTRATLVSDRARCKLGRPACSTPAISGVQRHRHEGNLTETLGGIFVTWRTPVAYADGGPVTSRAARRFPEVSNRPKSCARGWS